MRSEGGLNRAGGGRKEVAERSLVGAKEVRGWLRTSQNEVKKRSGRGRKRSERGQSGGHVASS